MKFINRAQNDLKQIHLQHEEENINKNEMDNGKCKTQ